LVVHANRPAGVQDDDHEKGATFRRLLLSCDAVGLRRLDICNGDLARTAVFLGIERNLLAFAQATHTGTFKRCHMNEDIVAAAIGLNEAESFLLVIKLYCSGGHEYVLCAR
jgi:hypothetical protein